MTHDFELKLREEKRKNELKKGKTEEGK